MNYSDEEMIAMFRKSLREHEEHKKWLQEILRNAEESYKKYFRLHYNVTKAYIKVLVEELTAYKNEDYFSEDVAIARKNHAESIQVLLDFLNEGLKPKKMKKKGLRWYDWIPFIGVFIAVCSDGFRGRYVPNWFIYLLYHLYFVVQMGFAFYLFLIWKS